MWLFLAKILFGPICIGWCSWDLYNYCNALIKWTPAKGVIIDRKGSGRSVSLIIKFQADNDKEIEFDSDGFILFLDLFYRKGGEVDVLYLPDASGKAKMKTIYTPITNLVGIMGGVYLCTLF